MKRGWIGALGVGAAVLTVLGPAPDAAVAQESGVRSERPLSVTVLGGSGGYLGVSIADVDDEMADEAGLSGEYGVYVTRVAEDGPAAEAGLMEGDVLVSWNGERLNSVVQLQRLTRETPAGREVTLGVVRDGSERQMRVELGDRSQVSPGVNVFRVPRDRVTLSPERRQEMQERAEEMRQRAQERAGELRDRIRNRVTVVPREGVNVRTFFGRPRLGVSIQSMGDQLADYFGVEGGALVTDVNEDSPAEAAGIRAGDVIVSIDGESVEDPGDLMRVLSDLQAGPVEVTVVREGAQRSFTVELEGRDGEWEGEDGAFHFDFGPLDFDGFEFEPFDWEYRLDDGGGAIEIAIPGIEIPSFGIPAIDLAPIEVPAVEVRRPRIVIVT